MTGGGGGSGWSSHADAIVGDVGGVLGGREGKAGGRDGFAVLFRCGESEVEFEQESNHRLPCFQASGLREVPDRVTLAEVSGGCPLICEFAGDLLCARDAALAHPDNKLSGPPEEDALI